LFSSEARARGIEFKVNKSEDVPSTMCSDASRIYQCLVNLINNAIKFTEKGHVHLNVSSEKTESETLIRFDVEDTGIGIAAEKLDLIFEQFTQAEGSTTRKYGGTGLGLPIARSLIKAMGGSVSVNSTVGTGSTFMIDVTLPIAEVEEKADPINVVSLGGVPVLVVDDNEVNRRIYVEHLTRWGATAVTASSGAEALALLRDRAGSDAAPALVLLDFHMPEMDGLELAREIRNDAAIAGIEIIVLSSVDDPDATREFQYLDVRDTLAKPVRANLLAQVVADAISDCSAQALRAAIERQRESARDDPHVENAGAVLRVLIAEDNEVNRLVVKHMLSDEPVEVAFEVDDEFYDDIEIAVTVDIAQDDGAIRACVRAEIGAGHAVERIGAAVVEVEAVRLVLVARDDVEVAIAIEIQRHSGRSGYKHRVTHDCTMQSVDRTVVRIVLK